jgi:hypothetical protein
MTKTYGIHNILFDCLIKKENNCPKLLDNLLKQIIFFVMMLLLILIVPYGLARIGTTYFNAIGFRPLQCIDTSSFDKCWLDGLLICMMMFIIGLVGFIFVIMPSFLIYIHCKEKFKESHDKFEKEKQKAIV